MLDPTTAKTVFFSIFNAGMIWGGIRAGQRQQRERQIRQGKAITRLLQYKAWSHRAISILASYHRSHHPAECIIDDWREIEEGTNGGSESNGND